MSSVQLSDDTTSKETGTRPPIKMLSLLKEKLDFTYIAIIVLSIALYVGFDDLISGAASGTARDTISAALAAIFVLITTMYMLNKQTDLEQEKEFKGVIFNKKFEIYDDVINIWQDIALIYSRIDDDNYKNCLNKHFEISMVAPGYVVELSTEIIIFIANIYRTQDGELTYGDTDKLIEYIDKFTNDARTDFNLSKIKLDTNSTNKQLLLAELKKSKKNYDKFKFDNQVYNKVNLVRAVVRKIVDDKEVESIEELKKHFPDIDSTSGKPSSWKNAFVVELKAIADGKNAKYSNKIEDRIELKNNNVEVITNTQWGPNIDHFIEEFQKRFNYKIERITSNHRKKE